MCGIVGFVDREGRVANAERLIVQMAARLEHRGPDDRGHWLGTSEGVYLGHQRLSVVDLSPHGHQPMHSACGRYVIVYNGEVYNFEALRESLRSYGHRFRGHSDTEVLLAAISQWGVAEAVTRFNGMFAFAVWDRQERTLVLARDRIGEKPLFYGYVNGSFLFASELKAMAGFPGWTGELDRDALALFMRLAYIPAPASIYKGIYKLPPATLLTITSDGRCDSQPSPYWSIDEIAGQGTRDPLSLPEAEMVDVLDDLLCEVIRGQMVADVPLGVFLSGGIDSSAVAALMQVQSRRPVKTFSIGSRDPRYNEADYAKAVAEHLGTDHTEMYVTPGDAMDVIPQLPDVYDEPFADSSQIPTFLLCQLTREHVTVALSGDGGDEMFGGYNRYSWGDSIWQRAKRVPRPLRELAAKLATSLSAHAWDNLVGGFLQLLPGRYQVRRSGDRVHKLASVLDAASPRDLYGRLISIWHEPVVVGRAMPFVDMDESPLEGGSFVDQMMLSDIKGYLTGDILTKVDRAAMAVSLETRIPFLDHRVAALAWRLPPQMKIRDGQGKWLLRQVLYRHVPKALIERPKTGFGTPVDEWLRGPLRDWAEALLDPQRLQSEGYLDPRPILRLWREHQSRRRNCLYPLWNVLMFQAWKERWLGERAFERVVG
jgi:asparagine synthase (glutamine-hydrolysing)